MRQTTRVLCVLAVAGAYASSAAAEAPPRADYCAMLARDIAGRQHGFIAGNHMVYVGGQCTATWRVREHETIGFTHPMFRDGRARGHGIVTGPGGTGHDKWGWEFWRRVRGAYGCVTVDGKTTRYPKPVKMIWRPDRQVCTYSVAGVTIDETKFIAANDVLCAIITSNKPVTLTFDGHSFVHTGRVPKHDGDKPVVFSRKRTAKARFDRANNAIHVTEGGTIMTKPAWKSPAVEGRLMYDGLSVVLSASADLGGAHTLKRDAEGRQVYTFAATCAPGKALVLTYAMGDDYASVVARSKRIIAKPQAALAAKTKHMNDLLNGQIPYFRCSDQGVVKTYYYLWSLYFMYFTHTGKGWEAYPHTQTAVNNFMGLHLWDSWAYTAMGAWVVDKWAYAHGSVLSWKAMVPFKNKHNAMPDNFGIAWYSPGVWMNFVGTVEFAWLQYLQSGDRKFLREVHDDLYRKLYWTGPQRCFGIDINAIEDLTKMAAALGRKNDVTHWQSFRPAAVRNFKASWQRTLPDYFGAGKPTGKDIWQLACMMSRQMPDDWVDRLVRRWVMNRKTGFLGPVPLDVRPPDCPENGLFAVSSISTWLAVEGMFRHHRDAEAVYCTLGHIHGMLKDYGYPVAPECWDPDYKPWGDMYTNWDGAMLLPLLRRIAGISYSIPDSTFTVCEHLPETWTYVETRVPIVLDGEVKWVSVKTTRRQRAGRVVKTVAVRGCPLKRLIIEPWLEDREVISGVPGAAAEAPRGHARLSLTDVRDRSVSVTLGKSTRGPLVRGESDTKK